jgi:ketosteroid isomerase-like protein
MKYFLRLCLAAVAAWAALQPLPAASETLGRFDADYTRALIDGDPAVIASRWDENVRLMTDFQPTTEGRESVLAYYRAFATRFKVQAYQREPISEIDMGSHVVAAGRFSQRLSLRSDGKAYELNGKYVDLWRKTAGGGFALVTQAWNYDRRFDAADNFRFTDVPGFVAAQRGRVTVTSGVHLELAALGQLIGVAVTQHDGAQFARFYADDAILLPNYDVACIGRQAIDAYAAAHMPQLPVFEHLDIRNDRVDLLDGYVIEYASHVASWRYGDSSGVNTGKNLRIWRREPDHTLKIVVQLGAYD